MIKSFEFYFDFVSPYSFMAHKEIIKIERSYQVKISYMPILSAAVMILTSILMVSNIPTYSLKKILIPSSMTIFLLLGIGIYLSVVIFYTFETLFFTGLIYIFLIPISYVHYKKISKKRTASINENEDEETEDVL